MRIAPLLPALLPFIMGCQDKASFEKVEVSGLLECPAGLYEYPLMIQVTRDNGEGRRTVMNSRNVHVSLRSDKRSTVRVRVGTCRNKATSGSYTCNEPLEWYYDQTFNYDPQSPQKLAIPQPTGGQVCMPMK